MDILNELKSGIANNETEKVLKHLMNMDWNEEENLNELILLSSRFTKLEREKMIGLEENKYELNEINYSVLKIIDRRKLLKTENSKEQDFYSESIKFEVRLMIFPFGSIQFDCPLDVLLINVIEDIVGKFNIPKNDVNGNKIDYTLISKGLAKPLNMKQTIWFNGVRRGDVLLLIDEKSAG